jgi:hypothetical protein
MGLGDLFIEVVCEMVEQDMFLDIRRGDIVQRPGVHKEMGLVLSTLVIPSAAGAMTIKSVEIVWTKHINELALIDGMAPIDAVGIIPHVRYADAEYATGLAVVGHRPELLNASSIQVARLLRGIELE